MLFGVSGSIARWDQEMVLCLLWRLVLFRFSLLVGFITSGALWPTGKPMAALFGVLGPIA